MANPSIPVFSGIKAGTKSDHQARSVEIYDPHRTTGYTGSLSRLSYVSVMAFQDGTTQPASIVQVPQLPGIAGGIATDLLVGVLTHRAVRKAEK
jgi:hypothetical protein